MYSWVRLRTRLAFGVLFNLAGVPGLVRECVYEAKVTDAHISVRVRDIYTVIQVNGLDIYFHRLTGRIDGIGASGCKLAEAHELELLPVMSESESGRSHM